MFTLRLARGEARFDVRGSGPRRWVVECGLASVEVVDAEFHCARRTNRLRVSVERGAALIRGDGVPDSLRWLGAGDSLELGDPATAPGAPAAPASVAEPAEPPR